MVRLVLVCLAVASVCVHAEGSYGSYGNKGSYGSYPTASPSESPSKSPTESPTTAAEGSYGSYGNKGSYGSYATASPSESPSNSPTESPTNVPTADPTKFKTAYTAQQDELEKTDMSSLDDTGKGNIFDNTKTQTANAKSAGAISSTDMGNTLDVLETLASGSGSMSTTVAAKALDSLAAVTSGSTLTATLSGSTAAEKKTILASVIAKADKVATVLAASLAASMSADDAPQTVSSGSDLKLQVQKISQANLPSSTKTITTLSGNSVSFTMPATLPAAFTGITAPTLKMASRGSPIADPNGEFSVATDSVSLSVLDDSGAEVTGVDLGVGNEITFSLSLSSPLADGACYYFDTSTGEYSTTGVSVVSCTTTTLTCKTQHLTEFAGGEAVTAAPSPAPTDTPTESPTPAPTSPTEAPTDAPSAAPSTLPSAAPTANPTPAADDGGVGTKYPTPTPRGMYSSPGPEPTPSPPAPTATPTAAPTDLINYNTKFSDASNCAIGMIDRQQSIGVKWSCCDEGSQFGFCDGTYLNRVV